MFSPSSLANIELCPRKFAWDKVDKVPREGNVYAQFGTETHEHLRAYYQSGIMPPIDTPTGNCAVALLSHLPPPQPGLRVEEHFAHDRFYGYVDLVHGNRIFDHKTTSNHKWAKTDLLSDLQACIYARLVMHEIGELRVTLQWNYVTRERRPSVLPVIQE